MTSPQKNRTLSLLAALCASMIFGMSFLFSKLAGVLLLREPFGVWQMAGVAVIVVCVSIANSRAKS